MTEKIKIREQDTIGKDELFCRWWECPSCKGTYIWRGCDFCPTCGKALEFDFEDKIFAKKLLEDGKPRKGIYGIQPN